MTGTKRVALTALKAALPIELVNFFVFMPPLDVGLSDNATWISKLIFFQWAVLHYWGIHLMNVIDPYYKAYVPDLVVWFLSGLLDTALVIFACVLAFRWLRHSAMARRLDPTPSDSA